ncbi:MAG: ABC transporter permease [Candidatus Micrarchaeota archaeon]
MRFADSFELSVNSILHRRLRAWLTLLGIIIGVAAVVSIISIGEGAQASISARLSGFGADQVTISPGFNRAGGFFGNVRGGGEGTSGGRTATSTSNSTTPELTKKDFQVIQQNPQVLLLNRIVSGRSDLVFLSEKADVSVQGIDPLPWKQMTNLTLASGRFLTPSDSQAVVIGSRVANSTFKLPITLGRPIILNDKPFTVVGILASSGGGFGGGGGDNSVYIPYTSAWNVLTDINKDTYSSIQLKVADVSQADNTVSQLTQSLLISRKVTSQNQDFTITSAQAIQQQVSSVTDTLTLFLGAIAAVSLLVGAIGVANSMFTSVLEKTHEIGILKALGASNYEVLRLFVIESALFGLVGGVIGAILGTLISYGLTEAGLRIAGGIAGGGGITTLVTPILLVEAIVLSTVIGVLAGIVPARTASRLKPIDALRYE